MNDLGMFAEMLVDKNQGLPPPRTDPRSWESLVLTRSSCRATSQLLLMRRQGGAVHRE